MKKLVVSYGTALSHFNTEFKTAFSLKLDMNYVVVGRKLQFKYYVYIYIYIYHVTYAKYIYT